MAMPAPVPVFFLSDSTGISAETMGNALLLQFPEVPFERTTIPFISTVEDAARVVAMIDEVAAGPTTPLVFTTAAEDAVRLALGRRAMRATGLRQRLQGLPESLGT